MVTPILLTICPWAAVPVPAMVNREPAGRRVIEPSNGPRAEGWARKRKLPSLVELPLYWANELSL